MARHFCIFLLFWTASSLLAQSRLATLSQDFEALAARTDPAVVQVFTRSFSSDEESPAGLVRSSRASGSGVLVDADGYILTNAHVVANARRIQVLLPQTSVNEGREPLLKAAGKLVEAKLIGQDRMSDLAVLKIEEKGLPTLRFGDSEALRLGQIVFAFGSPLGLDNSVTMGIVSSVAREVRPEDPITFIQTDAAINPGNSGGPLVDANGMLIGINTFIASRSGGSDGIGFAVPASIAQPVYEQIRKHGTAKRGHIGVLVQTITPALERALSLGTDSGVLVEDILPGSSAEAARLQIGDVIRTLNGRPLRNGRQFGAAIYRGAGTTMQLGVLRGKEELQVDVAVLERPKDPDRLISLVKGDENRFAKLGILAVELDEKSMPLLPTLRKFSGVVIGGILVNLAMEPERLAPGDVIHEINRKPIPNLATLRSALDAFRHGEVVALQIDRQGQLQTVLVEID